MAYTLLDKLIRDSCSERGDTSYKTYTQTMRFANDCMRDLSLYVIPYLNDFTFKSELYKVGEHYEVYMPQDFVYETKVGVCRDGRIALIYADNTLCNISVNDENCSCRADAESLINENLNGNCVGTTVPFWGYYNSGYYGEAYGTGANINDYGFYRYFQKENMMVFNGLPKDTQVIIEYKSNGVGEGASLIPTECENAIREWIRRQFNRMKGEISLARDADNEYQIQYNKLKKLYANKNMGEYRNALLASTTSTIKR